MLLSAPFQAHDAQLEPRPEVEYCFQCAVCGLVCVVNYAEAYEPRHTFVYDLFNEGIEARETLWGCPSCHKCEERCPYDFKPLELVKAHKEAAFAAGLAPGEVYAELESILTTGSAFPVSSVTRRRRARLGLPDLPEKPVDELAIIAGRTGLMAKLAAAVRLNPLAEFMPGKACSEPFALGPQAQAPGTLSQGPLVLRPKDEGQSGLRVPGPKDQGPGQRVGGLRTGAHNKARQTQQAGEEGEA